MKANHGFRWRSALAVTALVAGLAMPAWASDACYPSAAETAQATASEAHSSQQAGTAAETASASQADQNGQYQHLNPGQVSNNAFRDQPGEMAGTAPNSSDWY